jgi:hypothetical protein
MILHFFSTYCREKTRVVFIVLPAAQDGGEGHRSQTARPVSGLLQTTP